MQSGHKIYLYNPSVRANKIKVKIAIAPNVDIPGCVFISVVYQVLLNGSHSSTVSLKALFAGELIVKVSKKSCISIFRYIMWWIFFYLERKFLSNLLFLEHISNLFHNTQCKVHACSCLKRAWISLMEFWKVFSL